MADLKNKTRKLLVQKKFFLVVGPIKSSFSTPETEKNSWEKIDVLISQTRYKAG